MIQLNCLNQIYMQKRKEKILLNKNSLHHKKGSLASSSNCPEPNI